MTTIHWVGTGLSTQPGIKRLIERNRRLVVWNRTLHKAQAATAGLSGDYRIAEFSMDQLSQQVAASDIVVSMLPGDWHVPLATLAIAKRAHFISSSYISPAMQELNPSATAAAVSLVNEVGLDPGIDHLLAHSLVTAYKNSPQYSPQHGHAFRSYCGGVPAVSNAFRYKFSWSPLGVLKALKSPARSIVDGQLKETQRPWEAITEYRVQSPRGNEVFEAYPNRDSIPFLQAYQFGKDWQIDEFVRGSLRLAGWSKAWRSIFAEVEQLPGEEGAQRLTELSDALWEQHAYSADEADRVVLSVELEVRDSRSEVVWHQGYVLDSLGNATSSAMARLVSIPVSLAVEEVLAGNLPTGLSAAPSDPVIIQRWLQELTDRGETFTLTDYCAR